MTQDEIIEIFKGVGIPHHLIEFYKQELIDAANLVAQKVRDRIMFGSRDDWVLAEREACAKVCDELHWPWHIGDDSGPKQCAIAIRARGEQA